MITITCTGTMAYTVFSKTFCCGSNKSLHGKAGAAALIDTFFMGAGDSMACRVKIVPYLGETCFLFCLIITL